MYTYSRMLEVVLFYIFVLSTPLLLLLLLSCFLSLLYFSFNWRFSFRKNTSMASVRDSQSRYTPRISESLTGDWKIEDNEPHSELVANVKWNIIYAATTLKIYIICFSIEEMTAVFDCYDWVQLVGWRWSFYGWALAPFIPVAQSSTKGFPSSHFYNRGVHRYI